MRTAAVKRLSENPMEFDEKTDSSSVILGKRKRASSSNAILDYLKQSDAKDSAQNEIRLQIQRQELELRQRELEVKKMEAENMRMILMELMKKNQ